MPEQWRRLRLAAVIAAVVLAIPANALAYRFSSPAYHADSGATCEIPRNDGDPGYVYVQKPTIFPLAGGRYSYWRADLYKWDGQKWAWSGLSSGWTVDDAQLGYGVVWLGAPQKFLIAEAGYYRVAIYYYWLARADGQLSAQDRVDYQWAEQHWDGVGMFNGPGLMATSGAWCDFSRM